MAIKLLLRISATLAFGAGAMWSQDPIAPAFEVASIKPAAPITPADAASGKLHVGMKVDGARVDIGFLSLADLIRTAYNVKSYQISGPDWMAGQRFDLVAKLPEGASQDQVPVMLQALLADRFKLAIHRENKDHSMYALMVGKNGPKLKEAPPEPAAGPEEPAETGQVRIAPGRDGVTVSGGKAGPTRISMGPGGTMHLEAPKMTLAALAELLSRFTDRPVVDMTEIKGNYQVALDLSMDDLRNAARSAGVAVPGLPASDGVSDPSGGSMFNAVQQLGLRLEPRKESIELIVIDHLEKMPSEN
jgi:uncharacterized protein (TIGR03435 family)